jgi:hypothetical protein
VTAEDGGGRLEINKTIAKERGLPAQKIYWQFLEILSFYELGSVRLD